MIPVPVVGAFVGGVVGGIIGGTSTLVLFEFYNEKKSQEIVDEIEKKQTESGYWIFDPKILIILGINEKYMMNSMPVALQLTANSVNIWTTIILFAFLSVFYS